MQETLQIRRAVLADTEAIMEVMHKVTQEIKQGSWFVSSEYEFVKRRIEQYGLAVVAENGQKKVVAAFIVCFPVDQEDNLGDDLHLNKEERQLVAHMDTVIVLPEYRGHRLQQRLLAAAEQELAKNRYEYLMCTIHPENKYSLANMRAAGYWVVLTKEKYGGVLRHVLLKTGRNWSSQKPVVLVSSCLMGVRCRYNGGGEEIAWLKELEREMILIPVCPEVMGGLATPREPAERKDGHIITKGGTDVTSEYENGAQYILQLAGWYGCSCAILKERSPSCGSGRIYDGTHSGQLVSGDGRTAELLKEHNIRVFGESGEKKFKDFMAEHRIL